MYRSCLCSIQTETMGNGTKYLYGRRCSPLVSLLEYYRQLFYNLVAWQSDTTSPTFWVQLLHIYCIRRSTIYNIAYSHLCWNVWLAVVYDKIPCVFLLDGNVKQARQLNCTHQQVWNFCRNRPLVLRATLQKMRHTGTERHSPFLLRINNNEHLKT